MMKIIKQRTDDQIQICFQPVLRVVSLKDKNGAAIRREDFDEWDLINPTRAVIEIESRCNLGCKYCSFKDQKDGPRLPKDQVFKTIDELEKMKILEISLLGGEATLHPDFDEIWRYIENKDFVSANLISNGLTLNESRVDLLLRKPTSKLIISLDGFPEVNVNRNPLQYHKVMEWLPKAIQKYPHQIVILSCLYRESVGELLRFSKYLAEMGLMYHNFPVLKRQGSAYKFGSDKFLSLPEMIQIQDELNEMKKEFPGFRPIISCGEVHEKNYGNMENIPVPLFNDIYKSQTVRITTTGDIKVMAGGHFDAEFAKGIEEKDDLGPLGNISQDTLSEIWLEKKQMRKKQVEIGSRYYPFFLGWKDSLKDC